MRKCTIKTMVSNNASNQVDVNLQNKSVIMAIMFTLRAKDSFAAFILPLDWPLLRLG